MSARNKGTAKKAVKKTVASGAAKKTEVKTESKKGALTGIRNKEDAQRVLRHVSDEKRFYCHDGKILNNIYELKIALEAMSAHTYNHHVTDEKNDFARWVREVLIDDKLSNDLVKCPDTKDATRTVAERIVWLQARA
jgi:glycogen debranching enzyme